MSNRSPEYEQEVVRTLRLVRGLIYAAMAVVGVFALLALLGLVVNLVVFGSSSSSGPIVRLTNGQDVHAPLRTGSVLRNTTLAGLQTEVTILTVYRDGEALTVTARARGMDAAAAAPETWKLYFTDNTQQPMQVEVLQTAQDGVTIRASLEIPAGKALQFLHVDPDPSPGDLYFDIPPG